MAKGPLGLSATIVGRENLQRILKRTDPKTHPRFVGRALLEIGFLVQENAATKQIQRGGRFFAGGSLQDSPPLPDRLTSRTGRLRASIAVNRQPLPFAVEVGSAVEYAPQHEIGSPPYPRRPFLEPALDAVRPRMAGIVSRSWIRQIDHGT